MRGGFYHAEPYAWLWLKDEKKMTLEEAIAEIAKLGASVKKLETNNGKLTDELTTEREAKRAATEAAEAAKADAAKAAEAKARDDKDIDAIEASWKTKLEASEAARVAAEAKTKDLQTINNNKTIESGITKALADVKVKTELSEAAALVLQKDVKTEVLESGAVLVNGEPVSKFVSEWAGTDAGKAFVSNGSTGGGAGGGGGGDDKGKSSDSKANMGGSRDERIAAINAKFPDLEKATE